MRRAGTKKIQGFRIESLERRYLLVAAPTIPPSTPEGVPEGVDPNLWAIVQHSNPHQADSIINLNASRMDSKNRIRVTLRSSRPTAILVNSLEALGAQPTTILPSNGLLDAWVPADRIAAVAGLPGVTSVRLPDYRVTNVTSAGDSVLNADKVRSQFLANGIDGTGIKVGVISDGADHRINVGSELPSVTIDPSRPGSGDEGTAMLEIVHDLSPGAQLFFSGPLTSTDMVASINWLVGQGCDVIVDDLSFFGESYFSDSDVALAATNAVNSGVVYVTAAGNYSDRQHYQAQYLQGDRFGNRTSTSRYQRFSASPIDDSNDVAIPPGGILYIFLEWSDPWGTSGNDYDLYLTTTSGSTVASSTSIQNGNDLPFESIGVQNTGSSTFSGQIRIVKRGTAASRELEMFIYGNSTLQYSTPGDALIGQQAVPGVLSVAAAWSATPTLVENYSSQGGSTIYTNFATQTKIVRQTLDGTAVDGVQTAVGQLGLFYNPFFGTSAASPHAGAIAALVLQANPSLAPAQVLQVMADTATDLNTPGYDTVSGAGLYNALDAVYKVFTPSAPDMDSASDHGALNNDDITNDALPTINGAAPAGSYVRLLVDGSQAAAIQLGTNETSYSLVPGTSLGNGMHTITVRVASSSSVAILNNSNPSTALNILIDTQAPAPTQAAFNFNASQQNITISFDESVAGSVQASDLVLIGSSAGLINSAYVFAGTSAGPMAIFSFPGFAYGALPDDIYDATISAGSISDLAGNTLAADVMLHFYYLAADFNRDAVVDASDLAILSTNWQGGSRNFLTGDATYDGVVNLFDLVVLATHWETSLPVA